MLEWMDPGPPEDRVAFFESNRNLFYVACSRPKRRLALLFTQVLSAAALAKVSELFGDENVIALPADRSEEHTSELQSLMRISYAVFCLKTNKKYTPHPHVKSS